MTIKHILKSKPHNKRRSIMGKQIGMFVSLNEFGSTVTDKVKQYETYDEMVSDTTPPRYGIVGNVVYHYNNNEWIVGFPNIDDEKHYTAFEVYPNDTVIPIGESEILGGYVSEEIPVQMTHRMYIRSLHAPEENNVVVDWGDGSIDRLANMKVGEGVTSGTEYRYCMEHTYTESKKFIVKIYGDKYWAILPDKTNVGNCGFNLMCRVFDTDLPLSPHLYNMSSFCYGAVRLLRINAWKSNLNSLPIQNMAYMCTQCRNLLSATGFYYLPSVTDENNIFENCWALETTDYRLHPTGSKALAFHRCRKLSTPIENILPRSIIDRSINVDRTFNECKLITGTINSNVLWGNEGIEFKNTSKTFAYCPAEIQAQVPTAWGGTVAI